MQFNTYSSYDPSSVNTYNFYGLNRTRRGSKGEFESMLNMSSREYPCAAPREARVSVAATSNIIHCAVAPDSTNSTSVDGLTGVSGGIFYYNGVAKSNKYYLDDAMSWQIVRRGNLYVLNGFRRDGSDYSAALYSYNVDTDEFSRAGTVMDDLIVTSGNDENGSYLATYRYAYPTVLNYSFVNKKGDIIDNSDFFAKYADGNATLSASKNIFETHFSIGDEIMISGFPSRDTNSGELWNYIVGIDELIVQNSLGYEYNNTVDTDKYADLNKIDKYTAVSAFVKDFSIDSYSISGGITAYIHKIYIELYNNDNEPLEFDNMSTDLYTYYCSGVCITSRIREFSYIAVHNNRIFGCIPNGNRVYVDSSVVPFDFSSSSILSKYAARVEIDTPGQFTGIAEYGSELIVFKEDSYSVIYGSAPGSYSAVNYFGIGCLNNDSIQRTHKGLIFLSYNGFYLFSGSNPSLLSSKVNTSYISSVSGYDGNIYYASAELEDGTRELLTYDMRYGLWHVQDSIRAVAIFTFRGKLYIADDYNIYCCSSDHNNVDFSFTSIRTYDYTLDDKSLTEMWIKADVSDGAYFTVYTSVDNSDFVQHAKFNTPGINIFRCPIRSFMGSSYRYKIVGRGNVVFYEIELKKTLGGRQYKDSFVTTQLAEKKHSTIETY